MDKLAREVLRTMDIPSTDGADYHQCRYLSNKVSDVARIPSVVWRSAISAVHHKTLGKYDPVCSSMSTSAHLTFRQDSPPRFTLQPRKVTRHNTRSFSQLSVVLLLLRILSQAHIKRSADDKDELARRRVTAFSNGDVPAE